MPPTPNDGAIAIIPSSESIRERISKSQLPPFGSRKARDVAQRIIRTIAMSFRPLVPTTSSHTDCMQALRSTHIGTEQPASSVLSDLFEPVIGR